MFTHDPAFSYETTTGMSKKDESPDYADSAGTTTAPAGRFRLVAPAAVLSSCFAKNRRRSNTCLMWTWSRLKPHSQKSSSSDVSSALQIAMHSLIVGL